MSIALSPTPAHVTKTWVALAGTLLVVALMWVVKEEINPDWYGYAAIYSDDGAWLADQGRDPLFVMLLGAMAAMTGPDEYMTFRIVVGLYFATFTYLLLKGRILPLGPKPHSNLLLFIGILPFIAPRFTIQIREGIAVTLALFGMALVASRGRGSQDANRTTLSAMGALLLFVASYATHSGAIVLPLALLVSWTIQRRTKSSLGRELQVLVLMSVLTAGALGFAALFLPETRQGKQTIDAVYGWMVEGAATVTLAKWLYWLVYGLGVAAVMRRLVALYKTNRLPPRLRTFFGLLGIVLLPAIYTAAVVLLANGTPSIVISATARVMNMILSILFVLFALLGAMNLRLSAFAILVLIDQVRIIIEAIFTTFGDLP